MQDLFPHEWPFLCFIVIIILYHSQFGWLYRHNGQAEGMPTFINILNWEEFSNNSHRIKNDRFLQILVKKFRFSKTGKSFEYIFKYHTYVRDWDIVTTDILWISQRTHKAAQVASTTTLIIFFSTRVLFSLLYLTVGEVKISLSQ